MTGQTRPAALWVALVVGGVEAVALAGYALAIALKYLAEGTSGATGSDVSPWVLVVTYIAFAALIAVVCLSLFRGSGSARTPYLLIQAFALVVAQTLVSGGEVGEVYAGWTLVAAAFAGAAAILTPASSRGLRLHR